MPANGDLTHPAHDSVARVRYQTAGARTFAARVFESGSLRLRHPRGATCEGVFINTGGGIVAGDHLSIEAMLDAGASATLTSAAAEKVYRADQRTSTLATKLVLGPDSRLVWLPQETILFDRARLKRRLDIDFATSAQFAAAEIVVFGRAAYGERLITGSFRDSWRVRRAGRLIFADETLVEGSACLDRDAVARGARAVATLVLAIPDPGQHLDHLRTIISSYCGSGGDAMVEGAASLRDGIIIARLLAHSAERLRATIAATLGAIGGFSAPRVWL